MRTTERRGIGKDSVDVTSQMNIGGPLAVNPSIIPHRRRAEGELRLGWWVFVFVVAMLYSDPKTVSATPTFDSQPLIPELLQCSLRPCSS
jgi:hypothetical protein